MSDKHSGQHDRGLEQRLKAVEMTAHALKKIIVDNGRTVDARFSEQRAAMLNLDKKMDRILTVAVDSATKVNLMQRQNIHAQESCHPMIIIQGHLQDHIKAEKAKTDQREHMEKIGLSRWQKIGIGFGAGTGTLSLILTLIKLFFGKA